MPSERENTMSDSISRRKVTQGLAWSVPTAVAVVAAPMAAASPSLCNTEDLWRNQIPEYAFYDTTIDADGIITVTKPEGWASEWKPNVTVSYIGTGATATVTQNGDVVTATPPAGVDPFNINVIESQTPGSYRSVFRQTNEAGEYLCSLDSMAYDVA